MAAFQNTEKPNLKQSQCEKIKNKINNEIVISGMSGIFPNSRNVKEFENNLYNKVDMTKGGPIRSTCCDDMDLYNIATIPHLEYFDATFFGVHHLQADNMDPQARMLIEESFKAVMDAGVNPLSLRGCNAGVYIGSCYSESENTMYYGQKSTESGFGITGCSKSMFANRVSYTLGLTGPSLLCDTACSSSMYALYLAYRALESGEIDSAIVGGSNLCLHPYVSLQFKILGVLSSTSCCSPFDEAANGYTRSEGICCIFLQRKSVAKRIYATLINCEANCDGFKEEGVTYPSGKVQERLLKNVYSHSNIDVDDLGYMEAHSTGTIVGDPEECRAIDNAVCSKRTSPLLVGSVKSNCGHSEPVSALFSLVKVLIAMQNNIIPPNIHFKNLRTGVNALRDGRLKVVSEPTILPKPYIGVNSFGFGGSNAHALLKQFEKEKSANQETTDTRLVIWSSRTEENLNNFFEDLETRPLDAEFLALVQSAQSGGLRGMVFRGYSILKCEANDAKPTLICKNVQHNSGFKRPLVWVFSGMGSQWVGMGKSLMEINLFNQSIQRSHNILKPFGVDLVNIISDDPNMITNVIHSFVGISAIQIALVDILKEMGLSPDFIIGHSLGELGCAYADNCFTAEQTILAAYYRGKVSFEMNKIKGSMAAVGLGYAEILPMLPNTIEVACHNSADSCTISGPCEDVASFVLKLKAKNIFAKAVPCANIAYHSKYISHFGPELLKDLKGIIPNPRPRSNKWISTSVPKSRWLQPECKYSSPEYHTNNLLNSVLFEEAATFIPKNALTIEIAPHALLKSILKNIINDGVHIGLTKRNSDDGATFFLNALGCLYINGLELGVDKLYPEIQWPVSRSTSSLSHLIEFDHSKEFFVYKYMVESGNGVESYTVQLKDKQLYLAGHQIDGRVLVPATYYLECVWRTFASSIGITDFENVAVEFEDVKFLRATTLSDTDATQLLVVIQRGTGKFEVSESQSQVVSGYVREILGKTKPPPIFSDVYQESVSLKTKDFYKELKLRGYHYNGQFQGVELALNDGSYGKLKWTQNWVTFMDCMLQVSIVGHDSRSLMLPTKLRLIRIYPQHHKKVLESESLAEVFGNRLQGRITSGGIEIIGLRASSVQRRKAPGEPVLEKYQFVPHFPAPKLSLNDIARCCIQLVLENQPQNILQIFQIATVKHNSDFLVSLIEAVGDLPTITGNYTICYQSENDKTEQIFGVTYIQCNDDLNGIIPNILVINANDWNSTNSAIVQTIDSHGFVIIEESIDVIVAEYVSPKQFVPIAFFPSDYTTYVLLQKVENNHCLGDLSFLEICSTDSEFQWIQKLKDMCEISKKVILVSQNETNNGVMGLINCLRKEPETSNMRCVLIDYSEAPVFDISIPLYKNQLMLGLALNVYRKGVWGTYRHLKLPLEYPLTTDAEHVYGNMLRIGEMSSLRWMQGPVKKKDQLVKVVYSSLNFRDIMVASGRLSDMLGDARIDQTAVFGFEYSGIVLSTGKLIMGMSERPAVTSHIAKCPSLYWEVPSNWSLKEAATVPVVYLTVYYAFFHTVDIRNGKSILIHAGSGGIGISAIRVALAYGLEVYTTVSTPEKKAFLLNMFPSLKENHIGNSRNTSFEGLIMERTQGRGVDYVLNSLSEDKLIASLRCLGKRGHFLEIGKFDMVNDNPIGLGTFLNEISFHAVLADNLIAADPKLVNKLKLLITQDIERNIIKPLPSTVFMAHEMEQAFRYLMSGKHIGKVLIQLRENAEADVTLPIPVVPQIYFSSNLVYVVPGGLGGFGLELVDWMILRGARKIVLSSSRGISNNYQEYRISLWKSYSCDVVINTSDIGSEKGCLELLTEALKLGSIGGIFNLAVLLRDAIFTNQSVELFQQSFKPKAFATKYLDEISRKLCPKLEHFVVFSSVSCGRGNAGQTNYGMANSIMERIIEDRVIHGLPGKAIQWGAVGEVGLVAEMAAGKIDLEIGGTLQQRISSCIDVLDVLLSCPLPIVASMVVAEKKVRSSGQSAIDFVLSALAIRDIKSISMGSTLSELGMDSLVGVEIQQTLERDYDITLNQSDLRLLTFNKLKELSAETGPKVDTSDKTVIGEKTDIAGIVRMLYGHSGKFVASHKMWDSINDLSDGAPIIIFPGIGGLSGDIWIGVGSGLIFPSYVLQFQSNTGINTMDEFAQLAFENVVKFLVAKKQTSFRIVAYSFGAMLAHMTIVLLEKAGYKGKIIFIDGSPTYMESLRKKIESNFMKDELERAFLTIVLNVIVPDLSIKTIRHELHERPFQEEWLVYANETLQNAKLQDISTIMKHLEMVLLKIKLLNDPDSFQSIGIIYSPILIVKPTIPTIANFDEHLGLGPFTRSDIQVEVIEGNHESILNNPSLPEIINKYFS